MKFGNRNPWYLAASLAGHGTVLAALVWAHARGGPAPGERSTEEVLYFDLAEVDAPACVDEPETKASPDPVVAPAPLKPPEDPPEKQVVEPEPEPEPPPETEPATLEPALPAPPSEVPEEPAARPEKATPVEEPPPVPPAPRPMPKPSPPAPEPAPAPVPVPEPKSAPSARPPPGGAGAVFPPRPRTDINREPVYPYESRSAEKEGMVVLHVRINARGLVEHVDVAASAGDPRLDAAAVEAVRTWRFEPAHRGPLPVAAEVELPIRFHLRDRPAD